MKKSTVVYQTEFKMPVVGSSALDIEDRGMAIIVHAEGLSEDTKGDDGRFFVRLQSWDPIGARAPSAALPVSSHPLMQSLFGKNVRVTVEVIAPDLNPGGWDDNAVRERLAQDRIAKENE